MKDFYILTSGNLNSLDGANKFCNSLCSNTEYWESKGIMIHALSNSGSFSDASEYTQSFKHKIKQSIRSLLEKTIHGKEILFFNYSVNKLGKRIVEQLPISIDKSTWILINDLNIAANYYHKYDDNFNSIFMMHNSGELLSMLQPLMRSKKIKKYLVQLEKDIYQKSSRLVFVSKTSMEDFIQIHPEYKYKCEYIYNGIDDLSINIEKRDYTKLHLVTIGTVGERKNQMAAIHAIRELNDPDIELTIVGDGPMYKECKKYVSENNMGEQIHMVGAQTNIKPFLKEANAFIMTSKDEGLPIAATEALCASLPMILTNVGGCKELVDNNGILIELEQNEIVEAIKYFKTNLKYLMTWGENSRKVFEKYFETNNMLDGYARIVLQEAAIN